MNVKVKIKDKKHAEKVIKRLVRLGYREFNGVFTSSIDNAKSLVVYDDGDYQLLYFEYNNMIKPKDVMNSKPVKYFLENKHV